MNTVDLERLKESLTKLQALITNPELGLFTWHSFFHDRMREISELYWGKQVVDDLVTRLKEVGR